MSDRNRTRTGAMSWSDWTYSINEAQVEAECEQQEAHIYLAEHYGALR